MNDEYLYFRDPNYPWYEVSFTGTNAQGDVETITMPMGGNVETALRGWVKHNEWFYAEITDLRPIPNPYSSDEESAK